MGRRHDSEQGIAVTPTAMGQSQKMAMPLRQQQQKSMKKKAEKEEEIAIESYRDDFTSSLERRPRRRRSTKANKTSFVHHQCSDDYVKAISLTDHGR